MSNYDRLVSELAPMRQKLLDHSIYKEVLTVERLRRLMETHVFAVWDFMVLLKALQRKLTCVEPLWRPRPNGAIARLINEIVLCEESDDILPEEPMSHFELYMRAMTEVGARREKIQRFLRVLQEGESLSEALRCAEVGEPIARHLEFSQQVIEMPAHAVAAVFLFGRESLIPDMFRAFLAEMSSNQKSRAKTFCRYLDRHIEVDSEEHGPMAEVMLTELCGHDEKKWQSAARVGKMALSLRVMLWDSVL